MGSTGKFHLKYRYRASALTSEQCMEWDNFVYTRFIEGPRHGACLIL